MKKYIAIAATVSVVLSACNKITPEVVEIDQEVGFQVAMHAAGTKAPNTSAFNQNEMFGTFAIATEGTYDGTTMPKVFFMDNQSIKYFSETKDWRASDKTYYWPKSDLLSFISYAPYTEAAATDGRFAKVPAFDADGKTFSVDGYNVKPEIKDQKADASASGFDPNDLMYSTLVLNMSANDNTYTLSGNGKDVPTLFHHMLSKVNVLVKVAPVAGNSMYTYGAIVKSVSLKNIYNQGSYSNANVIAGKTGAWSQAGAKVSPVVYSDASETLKLDAPFDGKGSNQIMNEYKSVVQDYYVLPQSFKGIEDATIVITYDLYTMKDGKVHSVDSITEAVEGGMYSTVKLNAMKSGNIVKDSWDENTIMNYFITLTPGEQIFFDPAVSAWEDVKASYQVVVPEK